MTETHCVWQILLSAEQAQEVVIIRPILQETEVEVSLLGASLPCMGVFPGHKPPLLFLNRGLETLYFCGITAFILNPESAHKDRSSVL